MNVVKGSWLSEISRCSKHCLHSDRMIISDGLLCFSAIRVAGSHQISIVTGEGHQSVTKKEFAWVNTMIGNVKKAMTGTYHAINPKHLLHHLAEFFYRHNRRFQLEDMIPRFAYVVATTSSMPSRLLKWRKLMGNQDIF